MQIPKSKLSRNFTPRGVRQNSNDTLIARKIFSRKFVGQLHEKSEKMYHAGAGPRKSLVQNAENESEEAGRKSKIRKSRRRK